MRGSDATYLPSSRERCARVRSLVELHGPDLRYARTTRNDVLRRVYVAIRDLNWNTLDVVVGDPEIEDGGREFRVGFEARCTEGDIDFSWRTRIEGGIDGSISYEMDGTAHSAFAFAKIGICLHHPRKRRRGASSEVARHRCPLVASCPG